MNRWHKLFGPESVYFLTFHKCASSLFANFILKQSPGLEHVDYAQMFFQGKTVEKIDFRRRGYIYGPLRLSAAKDTDIYRMVIQQVIRKDFIRKRKAVFFIRDPRDLIVSKFYSDAYSHKISRNPVIAEGQLLKREKALADGLDEFCLQEAEPWKQDFALMADLVENCPKGTLLKYENMIHDFDIFGERIQKALNLSPEVMKNIYDRTRPVLTENKMKHRRDGGTGGFRRKLNENTIQALNSEFREILEFFHYRE